MKRPFGTLARLRDLARLILVPLFGKWQWDAPPWARATASGGRYLASHPRVSAPLAILAIVISGLWVWYSTRPTPNYVTYAVTPPGLTEYNDNGISSIKPMLLTFSESAAPLKFVKKTVTEGVQLSPAVPGTWFWISDRELQFTPTSDWPVGKSFTVKLSKRDLLATEVTLEDYSFEFESQPFSARIANGQFYQDPVDPNLKKLVATVSFSHPVDTAPFESHVSLLVAKDAAYLGLAPNSRQFTVTYDKFKLNAYVHSVPLAMPRDDTPMTLRLDPGIRAARGGDGTADRLETVVTIPGRASLRFSDARMSVVDNARYEPEQILFVQSSSPVPERAFGGKVDVRLLPVRHPRQPKEDPNPYNWDTDEGIGEDILRASSNVTVTYVPADEGGNTAHGFRFRAPVGRYLHVLVRDNVEGTGGYVSGKRYTDALKVEPYPRALKFLGEGALLSPSGDRKVGFLTRDVDTVRVEIGRVLPNQLQHLAKQMWDFARPEVYGDLEDRLVERFVTTRDFSGAAPGKPIYDSIDLGEYLQDRAGERRGLFLVHLRGVEGTGQGGDSEYENVGGMPHDQRLILVTDLGFIVKRTKDGSRDVFVQSIRSGLPVPGARVSLVGANGIAAFTSTTDATGRASLPAPPTDLPREKVPQMVVVERDNDLSFMPFRTGQRSLEVSRFDVGGVLNAESAQQLTSYLFSDRGIYRPGETAHLGMITRSADWRSTLTGVPLTVEITDPRGLVVQRQQVPVSAGAFDEITYAAPAGAATGTYEAVAYVVKNEQYREPIGSTTFRVQEFEPDRLKVQLDLSAEPIPGWLRPDDVRARVTVAHLFGASAAGRRVEGELTLTPVLPRFSKFPEHRFQVGEALKESHREPLAALTTDANGSAEFALDLKRFVGRVYRLNVLSRAFEAAGGRSVAAQNSAIVSDASVLVGVKPDGDFTFVPRGAARQAHWLAIDQQLNPVAAGNLSLEWVQKKFVSVLTQQSDGTLKYVSRLKEIVRSTRTVSIAQGGSSFPLPTKEAGDFALVLRDAAGARMNSVGYSVAGEANISRSLDREAELQIQLDKASYRGGDTMAVSIRAPYAGAGLMTIERDRVYRHHWFKTTTTSSVQRITLPQDFEGNGYVTVQFVRDPQSDELFLSPLSYGVAAFGADLSARTQPVTLSAPRLVKPGEALTMRVSVGEPSRVAVLAVDEGILQVARYRSPDPLGYFFQKKMLEVDTSQVLDLILPEFAKFLALAAPGGDADAGFSRHLNPFSRKRKAAAAFWSGIFDVGKAGREITYEVPDYFNGRLRIVAIAVSAKRVGVAETGTDVRGDFILTPNLPATVTPGDEFVVSVGVYNNTTGGKGPIRLEAQPGSGLALLSGAGIDLQIDDRKEGVAEFRVRANAALGSAPLTFTARRGAAEAHVEESVGIRPASAFRTSLTLGRIDGAETTTPVTRDLYSERRIVEAAISSTPLVWGTGLTTFLDHYEYSCTEQLVSKGLGALLVITRPEFGRVRSAGGPSLEPTFAAIRARLNDQGGLGLWSSTPDTSEFATVYAAHFLIESKDKGQQIPQDVLNAMNGWLTRFAATPASTLEAGRMRAYAVYLLSRQGIRQVAALSNVEQELTQRYPKAWTTDLAAAYLAATYKLMQRSADADRIVKAVPWAVSKRDFSDDVYYGAVVHDAQLLYLLSRHFSSMVAGSPPAALEAMSAGVSRTAASSLSAAYTLLALEAYAKSTQTTAALGISEVDRQGQVRALTLPPGLIPTVPVSTNAAHVRLTKKGIPPAYFVLAESGFDKAAPAAERRDGIEIFREFTDANGNTLSRVTVGQEFFVRLRIRATDRDRQPQIAMVDVLPGGFEPMLELQASADSSTPGVDPAQLRQQNAARALPVGVPSKSDWVPHHIDVREDRLILYGDATRNIGTFVYRVRANSAGVFQVPPPFAEGMYNRTVVALGRGATIEVVKP
jgi:uncharacterized protein YfaS (alpha-2-macroglobulin family)